MKLLKALSPLLLLATFSIYFSYHTGQVPGSVLQAIDYLPYLLMCLAAILSLYFSQSRLLYLVWIISIIYCAIEFTWVNTQLGMFLLSATFPVLLLLTVLFREYAILSPRSMLLQFFFILFVIIVWWAVENEPAWLLVYLNREWLPGSYFQWTQLPQMIIFVWLLVAICLLVLLMRRQTLVSATALGVFATLVYVLQEPEDSLNRVIFVSSSLLMCVIAALQQSWRMAYLDELTQLPGRRALREKLSGLVGVYTLAMIDVDHFKKFNDTYGHDTGDDVLRMIATQLKSVSGGGSAYRYGGEEFTLVFPGKSVDEAKPFVEKVRQKIEKTPFIVKKKNAKKSKAAQVTISAGLSDSISWKSTEATLKQADKSLYKAKKRGRNRVAVN